MFNSYKYRNTIVSGHLQVNWNSLMQFPLDLASTCVLNLCILPQLCSQLEITLSLNLLHYAENVSYSP